MLVRRLEEPYSEDPKDRVRSPLLARLADISRGKFVHPSSELKVLSAYLILRQKGLVLCMFFRA